MAEEDSLRRLFVLGVIHRDEEGPELLRQWLTKILPDVVTLEFSNYGLTFRKEKGGMYKKRIEEALDRARNSDERCDAEALSPLFSYIDMPYEYEVASGYARERNLLLYLIDMDDFSRLKLDKADELFDEDNLRQLLYGSGIRPQNNERVAAKLFFEKGIRLFAYTDEMYIRDKHMAERIAALMQHHANKRFLHVCGWQHLEDPYSLYAPLNPIKVFLHDKAVCI